ncbi:pilus assembly protein TadG-related protein [Sporosarcina luteola]|uniref:pilus assembly protein TadG-related protein n=1 Tax=Sporosarcina luteola TaxID=582850 RepID=UPI00203FEC18|nr:pilus assembly protein TadG-related protein [Sporosarcina luteola]MCM3636243.1 pilus assembly protein TadG-related protein [Sporosarcina luteola]
MKEMKRYLKNERGDGLMLVIIGMLFVSIFICFLFFDFSNVFISKRVSQTGADAAALAGARSSSDYMSEVLKEKVEDELESLADAWEAIKEALGSSSSDGEEGETRTIEEIFDEFIRGIESSKGKSMPGDIRSFIWNGSGEVKGTPALIFLFKDPQISEMACKAVRDHLHTSRQEAVSFTEKNQNDRLVDYQFLEEEFKIYAKTERDGKYITVPDSSLSGISASAAVQIGSPKGVKISCS